MKRHQGIGLPTAIGLCTLLLIVSLGVGSTLVVSAALNRVTTVRANYEIIYRQAANQFMADDTLTADEISDDTFTWYIYDGSAGLRGLVAELANTLRFYTIYDFDTDKVIAYQSSNFYLTEHDGHTYLADLIDCGRILNA